METHLDNQSLMDEFLKYSSGKGIAPDSFGIEASGDLIHIQLKAYIARNIMDNEGFYPIWEQLDTTLKGAIKYLKD